jgi:hypothetical protein
VDFFIGYIEGTMKTTRFISELLCDDDDDDVYLHRIHSQHKLENYAPYVKYRPARKGISMKDDDDEVYLNELIPMTGGHNVLHVYIYMYLCACTYECTYSIEYRHAHIYTYI